jgi:hypothetical protein
VAKKFRLDSNPSACQERLLKAGCQSLPEAINKF